MTYEEKLRQIRKEWMVEMLENRSIFKPDEKRLVSAEVELDGFLKRAFALGQRDLGDKIIKAIEEAKKNPYCGGWADEGEVLEAMHTYGDDILEAARLVLSDLSRDNK